MATPRANREPTKYSMNPEQKQKPLSRSPNGWNLFWFIVAPISISVVVVMLQLDLSRAENISSLIQYSVRCAVPWLYLAFAASSLQVVFPSDFSRWLLRNRKIMGLCFAAGMAWQLLFILWLVGGHTAYYIDDVYSMSDAIEGVVGYLFLIAMVLTSFKFGRRYLNTKQWKLLHWSGIYVLWAYAWSVYWFEIYYYKSPEPIDYVYYWMGFLAWSLRLAAWSKKRVKQNTAKAAI